MQKLFVGNLSFNASEDDLRDLFADEGYPVEEVKIMTDRDTGKPRGFGFVTLGEGVELTQVIGNMNGRQLMGRQLTVNEATPQPKRQGGGGGDRGGFRKREPRW